MDFITKVLPAILRVLDYVPFKGYRNVAFAGLLVVDLMLAKFGVISDSTAGGIATALAPMITYFAAIHK